MGYGVHLFRIGFFSSSSFFSRGHDEMNTKVLTSFLFFIFFGCEVM